MKDRKVEVVNVNSGVKREFIGIEEACRYLDIAKPTIYQRTFKKTIPHYKIGRKILFKISELKTYVESFKINVK